MQTVLKIEDLSKRLQKKINQQAEYRAALDYFCDSDIPVDDQISALKAVVKVNPDLNASEVCSTIEDYNGFSVGSLLKDMELTKYGYVRHCLWAIYLARGK